MAQHIGQTVAVIWRCHPCLIVSKKDARLPHFDKAVQAHFQTTGQHLFVRDTGGSAIAAGPDYLNIAVISSNPKVRGESIDGVYTRYCRVLMAICDRLGLPTTVAEVPGSYCDGRYNIVAKAKKIAGTAQRRSKDAILFHAVFALSADNQQAVEHINRFYCKAGSDQRYDHTVCASMHEFLNYEDNAALSRDFIAAAELALAEESVSQVFRLGC